MSKPTDIELKTALIAAATMKEHNKDPFFLAKSLLNHNFRLKHYEELLKIADHYINHGQADQQRMELLKCIEKCNDIEARNSKIDSENFGLE